MIVWVSVVLNKKDYFTYLSLPKRQLLLKIINYAFLQPVHPPPHSPRYLNLKHILTNCHLINSMYYENCRRKRQTYVSSPILLLLAALTFSDSPELSLLWVQLNEEKAPVELDVILFQWHKKKSLRLTYHATKLRRFLDTRINDAVLFKTRLISPRINGLRYGDLYYGGPTSKKPKNGAVRMLGIFYYDWFHNLSQIVFPLIKKVFTVRLL